MSTDATYFWRPGCPFCMRLDRGLAKIGIELPKRNIWDDPDAAAVVRDHANGNETVPTVVIGDIGLVNPSADQVARVLSEHAPELVPDDWEPESPGLGKLRQFFRD